MNSTTSNWIDYLAADMASRIPALQADCQTNNAQLISQLIRQAFDESLKGGTVDRRQDAEPKHCPFCGGAAKLVVNELYDTTPGPRKKLYWYACNTRGCGVGLSYGERSEKAALERWNTRLSPLTQNKTA